MKRARFQLNKLHGNLLTICQVYSNYVLLNLSSEKFNLCLTGENSVVLYNTACILLAEIPATVNFIIILSDSEYPNNWLTFLSFIVIAEKKFEMVVINPGFVLGPVLHGSTCTSMEVRKLIAVSCRVRNSCWRQLAVLGPCRRFLISKYNSTLGYWQNCFCQDQNYGNLF